MIMTPRETTRSRLEPGSVRVEVARSIEEHPGVIHGVGEVSGILRSEVRLGSLLAATFPRVDHRGAEDPGDAGHR